jgi:hypothetical protein
VTYTATDLYRWAFAEPRTAAPIDQPRSRRITVTYPSIEDAAAKWNRLQRGERIYVTQNKYHAGRVVCWRILRAENLRYEGFDPVRVSMDADLGPAVWLG